MGSSAIIVAAFLFSIAISTLGLSLYTVRGLLHRGGEALVEIAAGVFHVKFSAKINADRDDPEVVAAPAVQEQIEKQHRPPLSPGTADDGGGGQ